MSERDERTLERELAPEQAVIGTISFPHETIDFTDAQEYIDAVKEELPYYMTSGFAFKTLTDDAKVRKAVDDIVYDLYGEVNPYDLQYYEQGGQKKPELCLEAVKLNGMALQYVKEQTPEICMAAVQQSGRALVYVKEQTPEICMAAVQNHGGALKYVKEQTPEICMAAVQNNWGALQYVKEQTPEICMAAVQNYGGALKYVKEQTPELCMAAVVQNYVWALEYVKEQTPEICMAAVQKNGRILQCVKEQTPEICMAAVQQDGRALDCVNNKTFDICAKAIASLDDVLNDEHFAEGELDEVYEYRLFAQELYDHAMQERQQANMERKKPSVMDRLQNAVKQVAERAAAAQPREQTKSRSVGHDR